MTKKVNIDIIARDKSKQALKGVRGSLDGIKKSIFNVRNAFVGLGAGLAIKSLVNTGKNIESLQVRLKFLFGTAEEGAKAFDEMAKFAAKVPFSLAEIQQGAGVLSVVSKDADELANIMKITGNVAAVTGLDFKTTAEQIQRSLSAGISAADLFRDRGVKSMLGFSAGAKVSVEETVEAFERVFGEGGKFDGATDELAKTFEGTLSMIGDKIFGFKRTILEAGFFPELKKQFKELDNFLANNTKTLDEIAISIGKGLAQAVKLGADAVMFLKDNFNTLVEAIKLLIAFKIASVFVGLAGAILKANSAMLLFNATIKRNLFIAGAALVISQFDKILEMLGKMPKDFDNASLAIAHNNEQIKHYTQQLSLAKSVLEQYINQYGEDTKVKEFADQIQAQKDLIKEIETKLQALKDTNNELFKNNYPVYEDHILRLSGALRKQNKETKEAAEVIPEVNKEVFEGQRVFNRFEGQIGLTVEALKKIKKELTTKEVEKMANIWRILNEQEPDKQIGLTVAQMKELGKATEETNSKWASFKQGFKEAMDVDIFEKFEEIGKQTFNNLTKMLTDFVTTGKMNFQDFARVVILSITEALIGQAVQYAINKAVELWKNSALREAMMDVYGAALRAFKNFGGWPFGVMAAGATIGFGMNLVKKIAGFEKGGRPPVNQPSIVGEAGPELFVPNSAGTIIPNNQLGGGKPVTVNFNINTVDARGFNELLVNSRGVIVNMINSAVNEKGKVAII